MNSNVVRRSSGAALNQLIPDDHNNDTTLTRQTLLLSPDNSTYIAGSALFHQEPTNNHLSSTIVEDNEMQEVQQPGPIVAEFKMASDTLGDDYRKRHAHADLVAKALILSIAYAANIGGIGTIIGTPTNLILQKQTQFPRIETVTFNAWMVYAIPLAFVCIILCWMILVIYFLGFNALTSMFKKEKSGDAKAADIKQKFRDDLKMMGALNYGSICTGICFILCAGLWMTRVIGEKPKDPKEIQAGWGGKNTDFEDAKDSTTATFVAVILMVWPQQPRLTKWFIQRVKRGDWTNFPDVPSPAPPLISWKRVQKGLAWDVILLLGGGFALANMIKVSGLGAVLGTKVESMVTGLNNPMVVLLGTIGVSLITGFSSNVSTATIFLPILGELAKSIKLHVDLLLVPATVACSFAFVLPISTPPNAIAFSTGKITTLDMIKAGGILNLVLVVVCWAYTYYTGILVMAFGEYSQVAETEIANATTAVPPS